VVAGAVVVALVIGLALGVLLSPDRDAADPGPDPTPTTAEQTPAPTPTTGTEPSEVAGCTEDAAVRAAVEWMNRFTSELYLDDDARRAAVSEIAAADAEGELQAITAEVADSLREAGLTEEIAAAGVTVALPAGYRVISVTGSTAEIEVWAASIAHLGDARPLRSSWDTQTTTMACEDGEWRLVSIRSAAGPVPDFAAQGDGQLDATLAAIESFTEFDHAP
jgi:hypothetical protein